MEASVVSKSISAVVRRNSISSLGEAVIRAPLRRNSTGTSAPFGGSQPICSSRNAVQPPVRRFSLSSMDVSKEFGSLPPPSLRSKISPPRQPVYPRSRQSSGHISASQAKKLESTFNAVWERLQRKHGAVRFPREVVWLGGAPGAGKGTQSKFVAQCRGIRSDPIVMSSLLDSPEAKRIKSQGGMVGDETVLEALLEELAKPQHRNGVIVDGFPRTDQQVEFVRLLHRKLRDARTEFKVVVLHVDEAESINRQLSRGQEAKTKNKILEKNGLPAVEVRDTDCSREYASKRYSAFKDQYDSMVSLGKHFSLSVIDASGPVDLVRQKILMNVSSPAIPSPSRMTRVPSPSFMGELESVPEHAEYPPLSPLVEQVLHMLQNHSRQNVMAF